MMAVHTSFASFAVETAVLPSYRYLQLAVYLNQPMVVVVNMVQSWWSNRNMTAINGTGRLNHLPLFFNTVYHTVNLGMRYTVTVIYV